MIIPVDKDHPNTKKFLRYIIDKIMERMPVQKGKPVIIEIIKRRTPYPEFLGSILDDTRDIPIADKIEDFQKRIRYEPESTAAYINQEYKGFISAEGPTYISGDPFTFDLPFFVEDEKKFYELADSLGIAYGKEIGEGSVEEKNGKVTITINLYLQGDGKLWREGKEKRVYAMSQNGGRYKIMEYFARNRVYNFQPTRIVMDSLGKDNITNFIKQIGNVNNTANIKLGLKKNILEGKKDSGYKIAATYKITIKR